ncbi:MAG: ribosome maturation factor RimP [Gammaproteobacteria bacterium]|nr:MAG: ribosome maturation factor RimP [Gammaproteobacteria bacterium]
MNKVPPSLQALVEKVVDSLGYEPWGIELLPRPAGGQLLRVYIERPEGIGVDDCERVSRQLSAVLDVEDPIAGEYVLEVSSPGMDRPFFRPDQFARYLQETVRVRLSSAVPGRRNYRGRLVAADADKITLLVDGESVELAIDDIDVARLVPQFKS